MNIALKIILALWILELVTSFLIAMNMERTTDPKYRSYKDAVIQWLWFQVWLFTLIFWWFSPLEGLSEKAFGKMG